MKAEIIAIVNQKGGTGKTTTAINLGRSLAQLDKKVLLIDLDAQSNLTYSLGIHDVAKNIGELIEEGCSGDSSIFQKEGMDVLPTNSFLSESEFSFIRKGYSFTLLREFLEDRKNNYEFIIIDCPPTVSFLTASALAASDSVLIPMQMDVLSIQGLKHILYSVKEIQEALNPKLSVLGVLRVLVDERRQLTKEAYQFIEDNFRIKVFKNHIRLNVKAAEAPSYGVSILEYAPNCNAAKDYIAFADEFLQVVHHN